MAHVIVFLAEIYAALGAVIAAWFLLAAIDRIDPAARDAFAFRPLLIPGLVLLWPLVLRRYLGRPASTPRNLRRAHWRVWLVLSAALPLLLIGALALRQNGPTEAAPV